MKSRKKVRKRKSKIENPATPEHLWALEPALGAMYEAGLRPYKLTIFYQSRTGLRLFVGNLDPEYFYNEIYVAVNGCMESYIQSEFGSGEFEVGIYDENNIELGKYSYRLGGAPEYVHPSEEEEDFDTKLFRMVMDSSGPVPREVIEILLAYHGYNMDELSSNGNSTESDEDS